MDLVRHLRYFVAVADELHFGRAAERLHIAQSPLSQRIRSLEAHLGVELLVRTTRRVELTPAGHTLVAEAEAVLARIDQLESTMSAARSGDHATLRIGVSADLPPGALATVVRGVAKRHPAARLVPVELSDAEQRKALVDGRIDLGFLHRPIAATIAQGPPVRRALGALVAAEDPLAAATTVDLSLLGRDRALVLAPRAARPDAYDAILRGCHAHGFAPREILEASSAAFAAGLVLTTGAVAFVEAPPSAAGVMWRPLAGEPFAVSAAAVWRPGDRRAIVATVAGLLRDALLDTGLWSAAGAVAPAPRRSEPRPADAFLG